MTNSVHEALKFQIEHLENEVAECKALEKKVSALSKLCNLFGINHQANIEIVVQQTLDILSGSAAVYHRFESESDSGRTWVAARQSQTVKTQTLVDIISESITALDKKNPLGIFENLSELPDEKRRRLALSSGLASCIVALVISNKKIIGFLGLFDITVRRFSVTDQQALTTLAIAAAIEEERRAAEKVIRDSEERYRTIIEDIEEGYYETDNKGNFTFINDAFCSIFGFSREELLGRSYSDFTTPETAEKAYDIYNTVFTTGSSEKGLIWEVPGKDGSLRYLESSISLITKQDGFVSGFRGIVRDMTERRKLEFQLRQSQKMEAIGTLAGGIAHEFKNILGIIVGNTELALYNDGNWEAAKEHLDEIWHASLRAREIIEQMQIFTSHREVEQHLVSISAIAKESIKFLRAAIPKTIEIRLDIGCQHDTVVANTTQIHQVLINLCTNAAHAMQGKGGTIEVSVTNTSLADSQHPMLSPGRYVVLQISDTGIGIPADNISRIFDPYFSTKALGRGTGMGLTIVHGIVRAHGGDIAVSSIQGKGAIFTVLLPVSQGKPSTDEAQADPEIKGSERILFVDDQEAIVYLAKKNLERLGYAVTVMTKPGDALALFEKAPDQFDLVITDMVMPEMTGDQLAAALRNIRQDILIVICTGHCSAVTELKIKEMGAKALVMKPFTSQKLAKAIRSAIEGKSVFFTENCFSPNAGNV